MKKDQRQKYLFALFLITGVGFNLACFFFRELYNALFIFQPILLFLLGSSFLALFVWAVVRKIREDRWLVSVVAFAIITPFMLLHHPEWFRAETILQARLTDELSYLDLRIREDGSCTTEAVGMFMFSWVHHGRCEIDGNAVIFHEPPYDADLFPRTAPIIKNKLILRYRDGQPDTSFAAYFDIVYGPQGSYP